MSRDDAERDPREPEGFERLRERHHLGGESHARATAKTAASSAQGDPRHG